MSVFVTPAGFTKLSQAEIRANLEAEHISVFGSGVDLSPEGPLGQSIAITSKYLADLWEGEAETYTARDPDTATGIALDEICAETGITRLAPTAARAPGVYLWTSYGSGFTIPAGSTISPVSANPTYSLDSDAVISGVTDGPFYGIRLKMRTSYIPADTVSFELDGAEVYASYGAHPSVMSLAQELVSDTNALGAGFDATVFEDSGNIYIQILRNPSFMLTLPVGFAVSGQWQQATIADFTCDTLGANSVPALSLNTIVTPITEWLSIYQPIAGLSGTATETDTELRLRRLKGLRSGTATDDAIWEALYRVDGVSLAIVTSNREDVVDSQGRDPKSFECVVQGGTNAAIAQAIWNTMPSGIKPYGTFTDPDIPTALGKDGRSHQVNFSRPDPLYAWVKVTISTLNPEEVAPTDMVAAVKEAIVAWGNANFSFGDDLIRQKLYAPIYTVPGIGSVSIWINTTASEAWSGSWQSVVSLPVASREYLTFAVSRVEVA